MGCDVCISADISDPWSDFSERVATATETGKCCECQGLISIGERYSLCEYTDSDGESGSAETCLLCAEIRSTFYCDGTMFFTLWDDMETVFDDGFNTASECFQKLSAAAKQRVLDEWREWKGLN